MNLGHRIISGGFRSGVVAIAMALCVGCETVPLTGRSTLALLPESQLASMSVEAYREALSTETLSRDARAVDQVTRVGRRIAGATEAYLQANGYSTSHFAWEFSVIDNDETVNAFALPGGKIAVYTGILPIAQDDAGLAVIMGHEVAHAVAGHSNERVSQQIMVQAGAMGLQAFVANRPEQTRELVMQAAGAGAQFGILLPYSRLHESEADRIGLTLMAIAGYDPRTAPAFWQRMNARGGARPPEFLSTHPAPETRIQNLQNYMPEAMAAYRPR